MASWASVFAIEAKICAVLWEVSFSYFIKCCSSLLWIFNPQIYFLTFYWLVVSQNLRDLKDVLLNSQLQTNQTKRVNTREVCISGLVLFGKLCKEVGCGQRLPCVICPVSQSYSSCCLSPGLLCATHKCLSALKIPLPVQGPRKLWTHRHKVCNSLATSWDGSSFQKKRSPSTNSLVFHETLNQNILKKIGWIFISLFLTKITTLKM